MGTRGVMGFVIDGAEKITYNHWDSYPEGLGLDVLQWVRTLLTDTSDLLPGAPAALERVRERARALRAVCEQDEPSAEERTQYERLTNRNVSTGTDWYSILREAQGKPEEYLLAGVYPDAAEFPQDGLFCEWGYIVDLDRRVLEVHAGVTYGSTLPQAGRFADRPNKSSHAGYYPLRIAGEWSFDELPEDKAFVEAFRVKDDEE